MNIPRFLSCVSLRIVLILFYQRLVSYLLHGNSFYTLHLVSHKSYKLSTLNLCAWSLIYVLQSRYPFKSLTTVAKPYTQRGFLHQTMWDIIGTSHREDPLYVGNIQHLKNPSSRRTERWQFEPINYVWISILNGYIPNHNPEVILKGFGSFSPRIILT